jgi:hypothetical protein
VTNAWQQLMEDNGITPGKIGKNPMGQGYYTVIAFGAVHKFDDGRDGENLYEWVHSAAKQHGVQGRTRYEARMDWFGFFVAENGAGVSNDGDGCKLFSYDVFDLATLETEFRGKWPTQVQRCSDAYDALRTIAASHGHALPTGRLMLVNDYD